PRVQLAVRVPARQVVEEIERDADVLRRRAEMGIEFRDVAALGGDKLLLLSRLRLRRARKDLRQPTGHSECGRGLEQITASDVHSAPPCKPGGLAGQAQSRGAFRLDSSTRAGLASRKERRPRSQLRDWPETPT